MMINVTSDNNVHPYNYWLLFLLIVIISHPLPYKPHLSGWKEIALAQWLRAP